MRLTRPPDSPSSRFTSMLSIPMLEELLWYVALAIAQGIQLWKLMLAVLRHSFRGNMCKHWFGDDRIPYDMGLCKRERAARFFVYCKGKTALFRIWSWARTTTQRESLQVHKGTTLPLWSLCLTCCISLLLALIDIGSTTAFNALISLVVAASYSSFVITASVWLHKRLTTPESKLMWGPFRLHKFGIPIILASLIYSVIIIFFSFWPSSASVDAQTMNWSSTVFGGTMIFSMIFWGLYGRKVYKGPIMEITPQEIDRSL